MDKQRIANNQQAQTHEMQQKQIHALYMQIHELHR